ncbi:hypothetical protein MMC20_007314 [Loxospora ochrophaea]|nr:hypothetical protein [Loxospora ochrophaea]
MPLILSKATLPSDSTPLFAAQWAAWTSPPQALWHLFFPVRGSRPSAEADAIASGAARQFHGSTDNNPHDVWLKVVDTDTGAIIAGALWKFYTENPYNSPLEPFDAAWWPEGSECRALTNSYYEQLRGNRPRMMSRPHACRKTFCFVRLFTHILSFKEQINAIYPPGAADIPLFYSTNTSPLSSFPPLVLNILFTAPSHRRLGAASMLVNWGVQKADEMKLEAYVEGTYLGRGVYEKSGFAFMGLVDSRFEPMSEEPGEEWRLLVKDLQERPVALMWRPVGGRFVEGETGRPWERGQGGNGAI